MTHIMPAPKLTDEERAKIKRELDFWLQKAFEEIERKSNDT